MTTPTTEELLAQVPAEHRTMINGELCISEMGMIHFTTLIEQHYPEKAARARALRYSASKVSQTLGKKNS